MRPNRTLIRWFTLWSLPPLSSDKPLTKREKLAKRVSNKGTTDIIIGIADVCLGYAIPGFKGIVAIGVIIPRNNLPALQFYNSDRPLKDKKVDLAPAVKIHFNSDDLKNQLTPRIRAGSYQ